MTPDERLRRLREYAHNGLRYYATAYRRLQTGDWTASHPTELEERELLNCMTQLAHVIALLEGAEGHRAAMKARDEILLRYQEQIKANPWSHDSTSRSAETSTCWEA